MNSKEGEVLRFLGGQMHAMMSFTFAVIETHPDLERLRSAFDQHARGAEKDRAKRRRPGQDRYLEGLQELAQRVRLSIATEQVERSRQQGTPPEG